MCNVFSKLRNFPSFRPPLKLACDNAPTFSIPNITVRKLGLEVRPPGPASSGKGTRALGSLLLGAPSLPLRVSLRNRAGEPPLTGPGRGRSRGEGRVKTGWEVEVGAGR